MYYFKNNLPIAVKIQLALLQDMSIYKYTMILHFIVYI